MHGFADREPRSHGEHFAELQLLLLDVNRPGRQVSLEKGYRI